MAETAAPAAQGPAPAAATMNAKERRKLLREQERLAAEAAQAAAQVAKAAAASKATSTNTINNNIGASGDDEKLNAKQRRKLARAAAEEAQAAAASAAAAPAKVSVKAERKPAAAASASAAPAPASDSEKLNAKQRRLLARKAARPDATAAIAAVATSLADAKAKVKALKSKAKSEAGGGSKKRKRAAGDGDGGGEGDAAAKKVKSIHLTLFVGQLPFNTTEAKLRQHFQEAGELKVRMATDKRTNKFKGTAFIEVADSKALGAALSRHHTLLNGRRINVEMTAGGGGSKSELRRSKIDLLRKKQGNVQVEKTKALIEKHIASREYKLSKDDVDDRMIDFLSWFDYETAKKALEEYNRCVSDRVLNRKAFFMGILKRFRQTDGVE